MSSLDKLALRGVRSFEPSEFQVIEFTKPLTVIVGENGSGKTTIIECLKYITTGEMPPNTKGGAFAHDPNIAALSEVMACVKLRFNSVRGEKYVAERRFKVSKKKTGTGLTLKTLEGTLASIDKDAANKKARTTISTKNNAMDQAMTEQLGVSKAILENVIFCHQEDSNWPLSEPAALKKKFDDIFQATDWTKALTLFKDIRKEMSVELVRDKERLNAYQIDRDRANKLRNELEKDNAEIQLKQVEYDELEEKIVKLSKENKQFYQNATTYTEIKERAKTLKTQIELTADNIRSIEISIQLLPDSDEDLRAKAQNHKDEVEKAKAARSRRAQEERAANDELNALERRYNKAVEQHGRVQGDLQRFEDIKSERQRLIRDIAQRHNIAGYDHKLSPVEQEDFVRVVEDKLVGLQTEIEQQKREAAKEAKKMQDEIMKSKDRQADHESSKRATIAQQRQVAAKISALTRQIEDVSTTVGDLTLTQRLLDDETAARDELEKSIRDADYQAKISAKDKSIRELEESRDALQAELAILNQHSEQRANLTIKRKAAERNEEAIQSHIAKSRAHLRTILRMEPTVDNMEREVNAALKTLEDEVAAYDRAHRQAAQDLNAIETKLSVGQKTLSDLQKSADNMRNKCTQGLARAQEVLTLGPDVKGDTIRKQIELCQGEIEFCKDELSVNAGRAKVYESILKRGRRDLVCMGCDRDIPEEDLAVFVKHCQKVIQETPKAVEDTRAHLAAFQGMLKKIQDLESVEIELEALERTQIVAAQNAVDEANERLHNATARVQTAQTQLDDQKERLETVRTLKRVANEVARLHRETQDYQAEISRIEKELRASGSVASPNEVSAKIKKASEQIRELQGEVSRLRSEYRKQEATLSAKKESIADRMLALQRKQADFSKREELEKQKEALQAETTALEQQIKEANDKIAEGVAPLRALQDQLDQFEDDVQRKAALMAKQREAFERSMSQLESNGREIAGLEAQSLPAALDASQRELDSRARSVDEKKKQIAKLHADAVAAEQLVASADSALRNLEDNLRLRGAKRDIAILEEELDKLDVVQAQRQHEQFEARYQKQRQQQTEMSARQSTLGGIIQTMKNERKKREQQLAVDYEDIDKKYLRELVNVKTTEGAVDDIDKWRKALDQAIMNFHGLKMEEINDTIAELWAQTYQGSDIDTIAIKADAEGKGVGGRSYNYRVVMMKDEVEMDMRGRCSAGQKVLASIIIRLALAQSFAMQCGILALDEPTTNLDHDNILALANALAELVKTRAGQKNFQLLVITHDERFLSILGEEQGVLTKYSRVYRETVNGRVASRIEKKVLQ